MMECELGSRSRQPRSGRPAGAKPNPQEARHRARRRPLTRSPGDRHQADVCRTPPATMRQKRAPGAEKAAPTRTHGSVPGPDTAGGLTQQDCVPRSPGGQKPRSRVAASLASCEGHVPACRCTFFLPVSWERRRGEYRRPHEIPSASHTADLEPARPDLPPPPEGTSTPLLCEGKPGTAFRQSLELLPCQPAPLRAMERRLFRNAGARDRPRSRGSLLGSRPRPGLLAEASSFSRGRRTPGHRSPKEEELNRRRLECRRRSASPCDQRVLGVAPGSLSPAWPERVQVEETLGSSPSPPEGGACRVPAGHRAHASPGATAFLPKVPGPPVGHSSSLSADQGQLYGPQHRPVTPLPSAKSQRFWDADPRGPCAHVRAPSRHTPDAEQMEVFFQQKADRSQAPGPQGLQGCDCNHYHKGPSSPPHAAQTVGMTPHCGWCEARKVLASSPSVHVVTVASLARQRPSLLHGGEGRPEVLPYRETSKCSKRLVGQDGQAGPWETVPNVSSRHLSRPRPSPTFPDTTRLPRALQFNVRPGQPRSGGTQPGQVVPAGDRQVGQAKVNQEQERAAVLACLQSLWPGALLLSQAPGALGDRGTRGGRTPGGSGPPPPSLQKRPGTHELRVLPEKAPLLSIGRPRRQPKWKPKSPPLTGGLRAGPFPPHVPGGCRCPSLTTAPSRLPAGPPGNRSRRPGPGERVRSCPPGQERGRGERSPESPSDPEGSATRRAPPAERPQQPDGQARAAQTGPAPVADCRALMSVRSGGPASPPPSTGLLLEDQPPGPVQTPAHSPSAQNLGGGVPHTLHALQIQGGTQKGRSLVLGPSRPWGGPRRVPLKLRNTVRGAAWLCVPVTALPTDLSPEGQLNFDKITRFKSRGLQPGTAERPSSPGPEGLEGLGQRRLPNAQRVSCRWVTGLAGKAEGAGGLWLPCSGGGPGGDVGLGAAPCGGIKALRRGPRPALHPLVACLCRGVLMCTHARFMDAERRPRGPHPEGSREPTASASADPAVAGRLQALQPGSGVSLCLRSTRGASPSAHHCTRFFLPGAVLLEQQQESPKTPRDPPEPHLRAAGRGPWGLRAVCPLGPETAPMLILLWAVNQSCLGCRNDARPPLGTLGSRGPVPMTPRSPGPQSHLSSPESCRDRPPNHPPCGPLRAKLWPQPVMTSARPKSCPRSPSRRQQRPAGGSQSPSPHQGTREVAGPSL
ncbi:collagen alpha-2(I) chain-like [Odocoileus virginianus]|uniref:Collagen alpha-2(I) chain-like n=1 Tax=Odocoileus virginianus TaxID=9874 RepID=A0ABM4HSH8_ODOVR